MPDYKTATEKAADWNITPQHVQYLCRKGKVEGAIKRAGAWFIPEDAPSPVKNTKSGDKGLRFVGTKNKIFNSAIKLFMLKGYCDVSLRDIAEDAEIRQSTIYNHFGSKQEILDSIYNFYCGYFMNDRPSLQAMEEMVMVSNPLEIIEHLRYDFKKEYEQKMSDITKIIFQRISIDDRAREIAKTLIVDESIKYVESVLNIAVERGKLAPFDTHLMGVFVSSIRIFTLYNWILGQDGEFMEKLAGDEQKMYKCAVDFMVDLQPDFGEARE